MRSRAFVIKFIVLLIVQILLWNFCNFSTCVTLVFLPVMIMCLPVTQDNLVTMLIAFAMGFFVDFLGDGMLGLTCFALVPVAFCRKFIIRLVFGSDILSREEDPSIRKNGLAAIILTLGLATALFLILYIWADGAGTRPLGFNLLRFLLSMIASIVISTFVAIILDPEDR